MRHLLLACLLALCAAPASAAADEAAVRKSADFLLTLSDEDYADFAKAAAADGKPKVWASRGRTELASLMFRSLAAARRRASGPVKASADAAAASPDAELLTDTGWWSDLNSWAESQRYQYRGPTAVAAVRGGRKLSTETDKALSKALAAADAATDPLLAAAAYDEAAAILTAASAKAPAAQAPAPAAALSAQDIYKKASPSVVLIIASEKGSTQGELGTGSVLAGGRILTNAHVVVNDATGKPFSSVRVYLKPAKVTGDPKRDIADPITATVTRFDRGLDLALLHASFPARTPHILLGDDSAVEPGDPVVAIGHPEQGGLWTLTQGVVSTVVADLGGVKGKDAFQTDASINRGNSGGPLIDRTGSIIGVNTSMARKAADGLTITSVNFSVRASVAKSFLGEEAAPAPVEAPAAPAPAPVAPVAPVAAPAAPAVQAPAPGAELPPAPKTKPVIVTPAKPYRIEDAIAEGMKEMEDLESEMQDEIRRRTGR